MSPNPPIAKLSNFKGWFQRGAPENCPPDHLTNCQNCTFPGNDIAIREGLSYFYTTEHPIIDYFFYSTNVKSAPYSRAFIYLDHLANLWDASTSPNTLLHTFNPINVNAMAFAEISGRVFISPKAGQVAASGEFIYYWDGVNFSKVAGLSPVSAVTLSQVNPGVVNAGVHNIAVSFLYRTGYLSPPSPIANINSSGTNDIELVSIPVGPAGVVGRVILMSLSGQETLYFVPGGTINDNVTTTFNINVYDTSLLQSADYLNDVLTSIPSVASMRFYKGRLVYVGRWDLPFTILLSDVGIFDSVNNIDNIINTPRDNGSNTPNSCLVINNVLYILKPYGTFAVQDTGNAPSEWSITNIDAALGGYDNGVSIFPSGLSGDDFLDTSLVIHPTGLLAFNGSYSQLPLSWKIDSFWQSLNLSVSRLANDVKQKRLYVIVNTFSMLMMDYSLGLNANSVKWSLWTFNNLNVTKMSVILTQAGSYVPVLMITDKTLSPQVNILTLNSSIIFDLDPAITITQFISSSAISVEEGSQACYTGLRLRVSGHNKLLFYIANEDFSIIASPNPFNLSSYVSQDLFRGINITNEKIYIGLISDNITPGSFLLKRLDVFGNVRWKVRASITQAS